ncbi:complement component C8 alpha chain [Scomber japonicus]|uniref:complement component C8 alpha chain n=1 Tax=Scomber japonicus TaxID=13676 RepID=UPI002305F5F4|nr:complement component C8 alpha chain [Scomber japonicus]XP_053186334.1 complement component C8 alpha chain [Scomber japonicus]
MGILINLLLGFCTLHLFANFSTIVNASRRPWTAADRSGAATRRARAVNKPASINCKLGSWSSWTPCNSCTDKKFRFRYLEKPSQFGGTECYETLWERLACPTATTQCLVPDYCGEDFTCKETGRCISKALLCNGEPDCEDFSDEDNCESFNHRDDKCSTLLSIPGAERGTQGYNALHGDFVDHVLDPQYFGGKCEYVYNGEWRKFLYDSFCENLHYNEDEKNYRKPYNYHTYRFMAEATSEGSHEYYEDMTSLLKARKTMRSSNFGVSIGVYYVEVGLSASKESEFLKNLTQFNSQDLGFIRLMSKVETAQFKIRSNKLMLHENFYVSLMELPEEYDFGMYSRFINTFGTHYVTEGTMGGTLEYVAVINKTAMAKSNLEANQVGHCLGASIGINYPLNSYVTVDLKARGNSCEKDGGLSQDSTSSSAVVQDIVTLVNGGVTESSSGVLAIRNPETYRNWGASLKYNPTLIEYEIMPIYELVRLSTAAGDAGARLANLQMAWDEYLQQFDSCRCAPCRHNGIPVLTGTSCKCLCKSGYQGEACQETLRRDTRTDGAWSCWGAWSPCTSGRKTRTRTCTNPLPDSGGANCLGSVSQTQRC